MMKTFLRSVVVAFAVVCSGCSVEGTLSPDEIREHQIGQPPADYQSDIETWFQGVLKDPDSARYTFVAGPVAGKMMGTNEYKYGWLYTVHVNAKNSYGGYTGQERYDLVLNSDGKVLAFFAYPQGIGL
jgi:hypothetical protein